MSNPATATTLRSPPADPPSINLASIDLNLLVALDALLQQCNVTHAASTVGLSQPAMSRILARLRGMFDDDLLVRSSAGYVRTMLGDWLYDHLPAALNAIRRIVAPRSVIQADWLETVRLAMPDHQALLLGKPMNERLSSGNKNREFAIEPLHANALKRLEAGDLEMVVGEIGVATNGFYQRALYTDNYACLLRPGHPMLEETWTAAQFLSMQHVSGISSHDGQGNHVTDALSCSARRSHCTVSPNTMSAAFATLESDMILTVPSRAAARLAAILGLKVKVPPITINPYRVVLLWHERSHRDAEHEWIRAQIAAVTANFLAPPVLHH